MEIGKALDIVRRYSYGWTSEMIHAVAERMAETGEGMWHSRFALYGGECACAKCMPTLAQRPFGKAVS
jgi:hypothetical protein